ncbi:Uncharacterized protein Adt_15090 [Abeliophyllum distichum]|uniref:Uncharacterized protein n=1 Tax=Abeliophyllum distichum TaxID=126358 RepID=A0ABD1U243_9LAMI
MNVTYAAWSRPKVAQQIEPQGGGAPHHRPLAIPPPPTFQSIGNDHDVELIVLKWWARNQEGTHIHQPRDPDTCRDSNSFWVVGIGLWYILFLALRDRSSHALLSLPDTCHYFAPFLRY